MHAQSSEGKLIGTAGRSHAAVPRMTSLTDLVVADVTAITWLKTALKIVSVA